MNINVKLVSREELVQHYAPRRQPMIAIVLVVLVAESILANSFAPKTLILYFNVVVNLLSSPLANLKYNLFKILPRQLFNPIHNYMLMKRGFGVLGFWGFGV